MAAVDPWGNDQSTTACDGGRRGQLLLQPRCQGREAGSSSPVAGKEPPNLEGAGHPADRRVSMKHKTKSPLMLQHQRTNDGR